MSFKLTLLRSPLLLHARQVQRDLAPARDIFFDGLHRPGTNEAGLLRGGLIADLPRARHHRDLLDTTLLDTEKPGSRKGRPNHSPEFRRRIAIARVRARCFSRQTGPRAWSECESGVHLAAPVSC
ncbi:MAG: hypothetical protein VB142_03770 [Burkholderia sp.]